MDRSRATALNSAHEERTGAATTKPGEPRVTTQSGTLDVDTLLKAPPNFGDSPDDRSQRRYFGPIFFGQMEPDLVFFAFDVDPQALDEFWLVLDEPPSELRFRNDRGLAWPHSAKFAERTIDRPTRVAISGAELEQQGLNG